MRDLKQNVSSHFRIASNTNVITQWYDKEWDSYLDLDGADVLQDSDKLQVTIIHECASIGTDFDTTLKPQLDSKVMEIL